MQSDVTQSNLAGKFSDGAGQAFQVLVDWDLCKGHANCMAEAPEIFRVDEKGHLTLLSDAPPAALLEKARLAEKYCPTRAIRIVSRAS